MLAKPTVERPTSCGSTPLERRHREASGRRPSIPKKSSPCRRRTLGPLLHPPISRRRLRRKATACMTSAFAVLHKPPAAMSARTALSQHSLREGAPQGSRSARPGKSRSVLGGPGQTPRGGGKLLASCRHAFEGPGSSNHGSKYKNGVRNARQPRRYPWKGSAPGREAICARHDPWAERAMWGGAAIGYFFDRRRGKWRRWKGPGAWQKRLGGMSRYLAGGPRVDDSRSRYGR